MDKYIGRLLDNRYEILEVIGTGGMAVVYKAKCHRLNRLVAIKILKDEFSKDEEFRRRFQAESQSVAMLSHPNIVSIYDVSVRDDLKYIVMERVDGITLKNYMNSRGPLPPKEIMNYTAQILRALDHAHSKGIIHRDIKPQNIMLLKNGKIKVTDFGIAKLPNAETVTMTDKAIGTVYYISPEQASGKKIDPRSDIYSLGVVMYEMATGKLPFVADSPVSVALMQVNNQPRPPREILPSVPPGVEAMILTAMEKDPDKRFQSASVMLHYVLRLREDPGYNFKAHHSGSTAQIPVQRGKGGRKAAKKQSRSMFPIIAAVVTAFMLVLITTGIVVLKNALDRSKESQGVTVSVPKYVGSVYNDELKKQIEDEGYFNIIVKEEFDADHEEGYILAQDPDEGAARKVKRGTQKADVKLTVCTGAGSFTLDDYSVVEYRTAKLEMQKKGLKVEEYGEYDNTLIEYYTLRTDPPAGSTVKRGDTVKIFYSLGPQIEYVTIPTFVGMTESDAITTLNSLGISYGKITYEKNDKYSKGQIISQSKAVGSKVPVGVTEIDFTVSLGDGSSEETTDSDKD